MAARRATNSYGSEQLQGERLITELMMKLVCFVIDLLRCASVARWARRSRNQMAVKGCQVRQAVQQAVLHGLPLLLLVLLPWEGRATAALRSIYGGSRLRRMVWKTYGCRKRCTAVGKPSVPRAGGRLPGEGFPVWAQVMSTGSQGLQWCANIA